MDSWYMATFGLKSMNRLGVYKKNRICEARWNKMSNLKTTTLSTKLLANISFTKFAALWTVLHFFGG